MQAVTEPVSEPVTEPMFSREPAGGAFAELSRHYAGFGADPYPVYERLRKDGPLQQGDVVRELGIPSLAAGPSGQRPVISVLGYKECTAVLMDAKNYGVENYRESFGQMIGKIILGMEGEEHKFWRNLMSITFRTSVLKDWAERLFEPAIRNRVRELAKKGHSELFGDFLLAFPVEVSYQMIGLPVNDQQLLDNFNDWALTLALGAMADPSKPEQAQKLYVAAMQAAQQIWDTMIVQVAAKRAEGATGKDLICEMIRAEQDGKRLTDEDIVGFLRTVLIAAGETTTRTYANLLAVLLERPALLEQVRADRSLVPKVLNESLRYEPIIGQVARVTTADVELAGVKIPAGTGVNVLVGAAQRDPLAFEIPDTFDFNRKTKPLLAFGYGPHMCLGMGIAKMEMEAALNAMLDFMPNLRLDPAQEYGGIRGIHFRSPHALHVIWDR